MHVLACEIHRSHRVSVARFENRTVVNRAKVRASLEYMALMARLAEAPRIPYGPSRFGTAGKWLGWWRLLRRIVGFTGTDEAAVLAKLVTAPKAESEAALQTRINIVSRHSPLDNRMGGRHTCRQRCQRCALVSGAGAVDLGGKRRHLPERTERGVCCERTPAVRRTLVRA